ncbi:hypothetical protein Clacol_004182 [Clathrus columnatus]|uniref:Uncharacterized protein n=1 Tax=Clathrus columnatus TaxID=1419009 RepID=A0AAV5A8V0_9AGAM|nr:hypothetical protein Clacol_004182 [Clathrus columnatus]
MRVDDDSEDDAVSSSSIAKQPTESDKRTKRERKDKRKKRQVLEVEDDEQRLTRIQNLLENINTQSQSQYPSPSAAHFSTSASSSSGFIPVPLNSNLPPSKPSFIPKSEVLSRVESFLPQLLQANTELLQQAQNDPTSVDIENISDAQEAYIEMV